MKRTFPLIACIATLFLAACGGETKLPDPTGKGLIRAINAIPGSPSYVFKIEELNVAGVRYKESTAPVPYDDFSYVFNFDAAFPGDGTVTRVASATLKVEADGDHIFMLSGDLTAPTITIWNGAVRDFDDTETVFEARFSHASASLGDIDVYFDPAGTVPGTFPPAATLSFGEIDDAVDFDQGEYVLTVTATGDLNTVYFTSRDYDLLPQFAHVITVFDGDGNDPAPVAVRSMTSVGNPLGFADVAYPPQVRFIHSAFTLAPVDIYDDDLLTNLVAPNLQFQGTTDDIDTTTELKTYYFTPANSTATILFEQEIAATAPGTFNHFYTVGDTDNWGGAVMVPDRAVSLTSTKLRIFNSVLSFEFFDAYLKARGELVVEDDLPIIVASRFATPTPVVQLLPGSYDIYMTEQGNKTIIGGPYEIDIVDGDIVDLVAVDTVSPDLIELVDVPVP